MVVQIMRIDIIIGAIEGRGGRRTVVDVESFRVTARDWLAVHASGFSTRPGEPRDPMNTVRFRRALWDAGFLGITLDPAYGGHGLTFAHQVALEEEVSRYALPPLGEMVTTRICAPALLEFGSEALKRRHLPAMLRGEELWTQLLSEPSAGSDLASLRTRARADGDEYVVTGQKVWTSNASLADLALCLVRTSDDASGRAGLSMFIIDFRADGVTVRPLRQMNGESHFSEVFLESVRVPQAWRVGGEGEGWTVLKAMLAHERYALGAEVKTRGGGKSWIRPMSEALISDMRRLGVNDEPLLRQQATRLVIAERVVALLGQRLRDERAAGVAVGAKGSLTKLASAHLARQSGSLGMILAGASSQAWEPSDPVAGTVARTLLTSPMFAIAGGTSEIQRNTIGERVLGLPREPQIGHSDSAGGTN
jgi:alkylation response protein AidB-like acyl-CoA dehydrogenase